MTSYSRTRTSGQQSTLPSGHSLGQGTRTGVLAVSLTSKRVTRITLPSVRSCSVLLPTERVRMTPFWSTKRQGPTSAPRR